MNLKHNCIGWLIVLMVGVFFLISASPSGAQETNRPKPSSPFGGPAQRQEVLRQKRLMRQQLLQKRNLENPQRSLQPGTPEAAGDAAPDEGDRVQPGEVDRAQQDETGRAQQGETGRAQQGETGRAQQGPGGAQVSTRPRPSGSSGTQEQYLEQLRQNRNLVKPQGLLQPGTPQTAGDAAPGVQPGSMGAKYSTPIGFTLQAIAWSDKPQERLVVINNRVVREGEFIEGMQVARIGMDEVSLQKNGQKLRISYDP